METAKSILTLLSRGKENAAPGWLFKLKRWREAGPGEKIELEREDRRLEMDTSLARWINGAKPSGAEGREGRVGRRSPCVPCKACLPSVWVSGPRRPPPTVLPR